MSIFCVSKLNAIGQSLKLHGNFLKKDKTKNLSELLICVLITFVTFS